MALKFTVCRDSLEDGRPIVVIAILVPPLIDPTVFQTQVITSLLTGLGFQNADIIVESVEGERPYCDLSAKMN